MDHGGGPESRCFLAVLLSTYLRLPLANAQ